MKFLIIILLIVQLFGCSSTYKKVQMQGAIDISAPNQKDELSKYWIPLVKLEPRYPKEAISKGESRCLDIIFLIDSSGKASGYSVRNSVLNDAFVRNTAKALTRWKWTASKENPDKLSVITSAKIHFDVTKAPDVDVMGGCG